MTHDDVDYWRTLAIERQREIESLRARLLTAIDGVSDANVRALIATIDTSHAPWMRAIDAMDATTVVEQDDVIAVLDDLWRRVAAD